MKRVFAFALLLSLGACNRHGVADVTLDAAAAQRNATAAKTLADLQAAADASRGSAPETHDVRPETVPDTEASDVADDSAAVAPVDDVADADTNG